MKRPAATIRTTMKIFLHMLKPLSKQSGANQWLHRDQNGGLAPYKVVRCQRNKIYGLGSERWEFIPAALISRFEPARSHQLPTAGPVARALFTAYHNSVIRKGLRRRSAAPCCSS